MRLADIHSHILPEIDDGADSIEMSLSLLKEMKKQGITDVIATPHFYADEINIDEFKESVNTAAARLNAVKEDGLPNIHLGAEVLYFKGIGSAAIVEDLTIKGTDYLLLELSGAPIGKYVIDDLLALVDSGIVPILAHVERYAHCSGFKGLLNMISDELILAQINAESLTKSPYYRTATKLVKKGYVTFIGTDAHNLTDRPPKMAEALGEIERVFGRRRKNMFVENSQRLLDEITQGKVSI